MIEPKQKDDALLADIREADPGTADGFCAWWLGQSGLLVKHRGGVILFDPYLSDSLTEKYADSDKPHVRMTERVIDPATLDMIDLVTSSHNHTDHLDAATLKPLIEANPRLQLVLPEANLAFAAERLSLDADAATRRLVGLRDGRQATVGGVRFTGITAAHNGVERDGDDAPKFMGFVAEFSAKRGGGCVYHSGDTLLHDGLAAQLAPFDLDLALLPINGNRPERRVAGNLFGDEAARLAKSIGAKLVVPCHYDMFEFNTEPTDLFEQTCREVGQPFHTPRCGKRLDIHTQP